MSASSKALTGSFDTVLVANRGEIAVRVISGARRLGYRTVAVFSDADRDAPHVGAADDAVRLGPAPASQSYLDIAAVIAAAAASGAGAIHPGYGFLAENASFAQACADAGLVFIGPPVEAITLMGDKAAAKRRMAAAGVPLLAGYQGAEQDDVTLIAEAAAIGAPLMVKAAAGGGGKGMRLVTDLAALPDALAAARREATGAFGDDTLILERALMAPRHVEIQVLADAHGHAIALGERDCSVQRRHQKVIEEAPCPALDGATREAMQAAAVAAASDIGYVGAGTVEFLFQRDPESGAATFAFLEMNTRLQVEHPVTELVTGVDLVEWQLRIASGEVLTIQQDDVRLDGHAIEARLYAEDPDAGFLPQTGTIGAWVPPSGPGVRVDAGVSGGQAVSAHYDPMLAKVIAHGRDRDEARRRLASALDALVCTGPRTNRTFLSAVLRHPVFAAGEATTAFLGEHSIGGGAADNVTVAGAVGGAHLRRRAVTATAALAGWHNTVWLRHERLLRVNGQPTVATLADLADGVEVTLGEDVHRVELDASGGVRVDGRPVPMALHVAADGTMHVATARADVVIIDVTEQPADSAIAGGAGVLLAPMHGAVTAISARLGATVAAGDPVAVMEAMKMEHVVAADVAGTVSEVVAVGDQVGHGDVVARIDPSEPAPNVQQEG